VIEYLLWSPCFILIVTTTINLSGWRLKPSFGIWRYVFYVASVRVELHNEQTECWNGATSIKSRLFSALGFTEVDL